MGLNLQLVGFLYRSDPVWPNDLRVTPLSSRLKCSQSIRMSCSRFSNMRTTSALCTSTRTFLPPSIWTFREKYVINLVKNAMGDRKIPSYRKGRTYADFELYMTQHPDAPVVEREEKFSIFFIPNLEPRPMDGCFL